MKEIANRIKKIISFNKDISLWIIIYAICSYLINYNFILETTQSGSVLFSALIIPIMFLITILVILKSMSLSKHVCFTWGLLLDKTAKHAWFAWIGLVVFTVVYMFFHHPVISSFDDMAIYSLTLLHLTTQELILRAFLISYIVNIVGESKKDIFFAIVISSILIAFVQKPFSDISPDTNFIAGIFVGLFFGYVYNYTKSIIIFLYFPLVTRTGDLLPHLTEGNMVVILCFSLLLYIALSGICFVFRKEQLIAET